MERVLPYVVSTYIQVLEHTQELANASEREDPLQNRKENGYGVLCLESQRKIISEMKK